MLCRRQGNKVDYSRWQNNLRILAEEGQAEGGDITSQMDKASAMV